ncbi:MAG: glycosyltransferase family 2 protein [Candidatus Hydrothermia bacterium]
MLVSYIIPCKNSEKTIGKTLESFKKQTSDNFEIIIVDNSTDSTPKILEDYKEKVFGEKMKIFYYDHKCASEARNYGLLQASGEYICFFDSDDLVLPELTKRIQHVATNYNPEIIIWNRLIVEPGDAESLYEKHSNQIKELQIRQFDGLYFLKLTYKFRSFWIWIGNISYSKDYLIKKRLKFPEEFVFGEDPYFSFQALIDSKHCIYVDEILVLYVQAPGSLTRKYHPRFPDQVIAFLEMAKIAEKKAMETTEETKRNTLLEIAHKLRCEWAISAFVNHFFLNTHNLSKTTGARNAIRTALLNIHQRYPELKGNIFQNIENCENRFIYQIYGILAKKMFDLKNVILLRFLLPVFVVIRRLKR